MNKLIIWNLSFSAGVRYKVSIPQELKKSGPVIIVSNHQSMYDIPLFVVYLQALTPNFISKKELERWIPSISFALRNLDSLTINRSDQKNAASAISQYAKKMSDENLTVVMFPEGTRARDGVLKSFKSTGLKILLEAAPNATVIPVVIDGNWEILKHNFLPVPFGCRVSLDVLDPIPSQSLDPENAAETLQKIISTRLELLRAPKS